MGKQKDIRDDEILIIGSQSQSRRRGGVAWIIATLIIVVGVIGGVVVLMSEPSAPASKEKPAKQTKSVEQDEIGVFEQEAVAKSQAQMKAHIGQSVDSLAAGFCEIKDTIINEVPLRIFIPHNAEMSLHVGKVDKSDEKIVYVAQAADIRADNGKILGAFVMAGKELAWGLTKKGYCASIEGRVTIGTADNSPLFDEAVAKKGHFFRQYSLVNNGVAVENKPENISVRRAICDRYGEIFMVESLDKMSFLDFSHALVGLGVEQAIYLVGSDAYGWAVDQKGKKLEFGVPNYYTGRRKMPKNTSYIIWRKK